MDWLDKGIKDYYNLLKAKTYFNKDNNTNWFIISTPFVGAFNDTIELFVKKDDYNNKIIISDDGITIHNLDLQGVTFVKSPRRQKLLDRVITTYGLTLNDNEIAATTTIDKFAQKKYDMINAIQEINSFSVLSKSTVASLFKEDVKNYLDENDIIYTPEFISKGKTGLDFTFDFQIASKTTEIVIKAFSSINKNNLSSFLFSWEDIKENRENLVGKKLQAIVIINDTEKSIGEEYIEALDIKKANFISWTQRNQQQFINKLKVA